MLLRPVVMVCDVPDSNIATRTGTHSQHEYMPGFSDEP